MRIDDLIEHLEHVKKVSGNIECGISRDICGEDVLHHLNSALVDTYKGRKIVVFESGLSFSCKDALRGEK